MSVNQVDTDSFAPLTRQVQGLTIIVNDQARQIEENEAKFSRRDEPSRNYRVEDFEYYE